MSASRSNDYDPYRCMPLAGVLGRCSDVAEPFPRHVVGYALEDATPTDYCAPLDSCPAFLDYRARKACRDDTECADSGLCATGGSGSSTCSLACGVRPTCLSGDVCSQRSGLFGSDATECRSP